MGTEVATGLCVTRGALNAPDSTFIWDVVENAGALTVKVLYGGGTDNSNIQTAKIPAGSTALVNLSAATNPGAIGVTGRVSAAWSDNNESYVVIFSGQMVRPGVNNITSSDQNGTAVDNFPTIVYAYMN
ncbi:MAG TPA: hypothetical protein VF782_13415 [Allosphingosinicella sp.]|jgi:hypothetical protein